MPTDSTLSIRRLQPLDGVDRVSLTDIESEMALVGSLLAHPEAIQGLGNEVEADWFADSGTSAFFSAIKAVSDAGGEISRQAVIASLPSFQSDPLLSFKLYIKLVDNAVPEQQIPGVLRVVRDRWARRTMQNVSDVIADNSALLNQDPFELSNEVTAQIDRLNSSRVRNDTGTMDDSVKKLMTAIMTPDRMRGAPTGIKALDDKLNGYVRGHLYVLGARPGMGKSAFMISSLRATAQAGHGVAMFSMEMEQEECAARFLSDIMSDLKAPFFGSIMRGDIMPHQMDALGDATRQYSGLPIHVDASASLSVEDIIGRVRKVKQMFEANGFPLSVVCIDHLTEIKASNRYAGNPVMEVSEAVKRLRVAAKELDTCILLLCQLSRESEKRDNKRPTLADLRWSGEIEQAAHVVAFLYREGYYVQNDPNADPSDIMNTKHKLEFLVRKNRQGETGDIELWCSMAHSSVRDGR